MSTKASLKSAGIALLLGTLSLGGALPAFAHAHLVSATPAVGAMAMPAPKELRLTFSEGLDLKESSVKVSTPDKTEVKTGPLALDPKDNKVLIVPLTTTLPDNNYTVDWKVKSTDGHTTSGNYTFESME